MASKEITEFEPVKENAFGGISHDREGNSLIIQSAGAGFFGNVGAPLLLPKLRKYIYFTPAMKCSDLQDGPWRVLNADFSTILLAPKSKCVWEESTYLLASYHVITGIEYGMWSDMNGFVWQDERLYSPPGTNQRSGIFKLDGSNTGYLGVILTLAGGFPPIALRFAKSTNLHLGASATWASTHSGEITTIDSFVYTYVSVHAFENNGSCFACWVYKSGSHYYLEMWVSADAGVTWAKKYSEDSSSSFVPVLKWTFIQDSSNIQLFYDRSDSNTPEYIYTTDNGATWTKATPSTLSYTSTTTACPGVIAANGDYVICNGTDVWVSSDNGASWSSVKSVSPGPWGTILIRATNDHLFNCYLGGSSKLYISESSDDGATWTDTDTGLTGIADVWTMKG